MLRPTSILLASLLAACGGSRTPALTPAAVASAEASSVAEATETAAPDPPPEGPLPDDVTPLHYRLALEVVPERERFRGSVEIRVRLASPTRRIWIHGARMDVSSATIAHASDGVEVPLRWEPAGARGELAALRSDREIAAGEATIHIAFEAPFDRQLKGLYRVDVGNDHYAFTQFEATSARYAFPCFDEPRFKTPFDVELTVRAEDVAIANTAEIASESAGPGMRRVRFATTLPLPTYLVALAVGPLDVVQAPPIPPNAVRSRALALRGIAARGRGPELRHALEQTPAILAALEAYFGTEYPFDKLDIIAVPDFASGAMENAGAITFREALLLIGPDAPEEQLRGFALVMAHELAHQWFGNLVTMPWWDDIWLNEAFATWMASRIVAEVHPEMHAELARLVSIHQAMGQDALEAARQIRQPIESDHDIRNAFDAITYSKGAGVLAMFEGWLGEDVFRDGIRLYVRRHRLGTARSEDLFDALGEVAGRDVGTPLRTFVEQPGVPLLEVRLACSAGEDPVLEVAQSRYAPVGSTIERRRTWQVPLCVTYPTRGGSPATQCELVTEPVARLALRQAEGCPAWVLPNAGASGYYRWTLPPEQLAALFDRGWRALSPAERLSVASGLRAAFASATMPATDLLPLLARIAEDPTRAVAVEPMALATTVLDTIATDEQLPAARAWAASLYSARARALGWTPRRGEDGETRLLRRDVIAFLALTARDPEVRAEAARRGRAYVGYGGDGAIHREAVPADLAGVALSVAVQQGDAAFFEAVLAHVFATEDALLRARLLGALASADDPTLARRALDLALDPRLRVNEITIPLGVQAERREARAAALAWLEASYDPLVARLATTRAGMLPWFFAGFCDEGARERVATFFEPRIGELAGGPRNLRGALEAIALCVARTQAQRGPFTAFLERRHHRTSPRSRPR